MANVGSNQDIVDFISTLPEKDKTTIRFFERSKSGADRFIVVGEDASFIAHEVRGTKQVLKGDSDDLPYVPVSQVQFEAEVREILLSLRYKVQMYIRCSSPLIQANWILDFEATPGNLGPLEDILYTSSDHLSSRGLLVVSMSNVDGVTTLGTAYIDLTGKTIDLCHFEDDSAFSNFESILVMLAPRECLVPNVSNVSKGSKTSMYESLIEKLNLNGISVTGHPFDRKFDREIIENSLKALTTREKYEKVALSMIEGFPEPGKQLVMESLHAGISYLGLMGDSSKHHQFEVKEVKPRLFMRLDMTAVSSLNLFPENKQAKLPFELGRNDKKTLFGLLNRCRTHPAQRLLSQWIRQPLIDRNKIEERLCLVDFFVEEVGIRQVVHDEKLRKVPDLVKLSQKFASKTITLSDMYQTYIFLKSLPSVIDVIGEENMYARINVTERLVMLMEKLEKLKDLVETTVDIEKYENESELRIRSDFDEELGELGSKLDGLESSVRRNYRRVRSDLGLDDDVKLMNEKGEFFYSVTNKREKLIRDSDGYIITESNKSGTKFVTPSLQSINEEYSVVSEEFAEKQKAVMVEIKDVVQTYYECIKELGDVISFLDVIVSLATVAVSSSGSYVRPEILHKGSGKVVMKQVRHPCLEAQGIDFIPNDVTLDEDKHKFLLMTGPNMGGKSTYIRSIGIAVLMAQIGSYVAAESAVISVLDGIYTRVGAADQQLQGNSTFMTEMVETSSIIRSATENSLVIIDELGRGTSTFDGLGLAWAISRHIATEIKAFTLFATHYHELTHLSKEVTSVGNVHVSAFTSDTEVCMTYQVQEGVCDQSYGIHVAKLAGFPPEMIQKAKEKLDQLEGGGDVTKEFDLIRIKSGIKSFDPESKSDEEILSFIEELKTYKRL